LGDKESEPTAQSGENFLGPIVMYFNPGILEKEVWKAWCIQNTCPPFASEDSKGAIVTTAEVRIIDPSVLFLGGKSPCKSNQLSFASGAPSIFL
jgi:hypothetical protein